MKLRLKIIKENLETLTESRYDGLYQLTDIHPGSIDMFIKHFLDVPGDVSTDRRSFIESSYGDKIEALTEEDIPATSKRTSKTPLDKVKRALLQGHTFWWNEIFGPQMASEIIRHKASAYLAELGANLNRINYSEMTGPEFEALPSQDKALVYEKHFMEDNLADFFDKHVKMSSMNSTGFLSNPGVGTGLYGQMADWWMSTSGSDMLRDSITNQLTTLPQR